jgi:hypothetical protein
MKPETILRALRNSNSPAARLAAWQNDGVTRNLRTLRHLMVSGKTLRNVRKEMILSDTFELSSPDAETPTLWLGNTSPAILDSWQGSQFLDHSGWFTDDEIQDETIQAYAVRLKMFPGIIFEAVVNSMNGDFQVDLSSFEEIDYSDSDDGYAATACETDCARSVIQSADSTAESLAEDEREYQRKWRIENDISENKETLKTLRTEIRQLVRELKALCPSALATTYPAAANAVTGSLKRLLADRRKLMATNATLAGNL